MSEKPRALFFGTPEFAVPCLRVVHALCDVVTVVTQPDRPAGRGMKLTPPPVKALALELQLPVLQPLKVRTPEFAEQLEGLRADVAVVVAYGRILTPRVLQAPRLGCVNVHGSLLPKLRGAAPIQWAIVRGDHETGVCLMQMDEGMDTGPELARATLAIGAEETAGELSPRLSALGAALLERELPRFLRGELIAVAQPHEHATHAPVLKKEDGQVRWAQSARAIHDLVRGLSPWPGAYTWLGATRVKLHKTTLTSAPISAHATATPGAILRADSGGILVACGEGALLVTELQLEGSKRLPAATFVSGQRLANDARFFDTQQNPIENG